MLNLKISLNLGILAKHLNNFNNYDFALDSSNNTNNNTNNKDTNKDTNNTDNLVTNILSDINDITFLKNQLVIVTKKYIKYKSKYTSIKTEISSSYKK
jgi:hypothetical protein